MCLKLIENKTLASILKHCETVTTRKETEVELQLSTQLARAKAGIMGSKKFLVVFRHFLWVSYDAV